MRAGVIVTNLYTLVKHASGGRWYAPKCVTPGVSAWSHRSSINISIKIKHVQQYMSSSSSCSSCIMYHVSCIMYHVSCIMYHVSCIMCHVSCVMCHVSCVMYHVSRIIMYHVSCIMYHVSCI